MTVVKVTCPKCGDLDLQVWQLLVRDESTGFVYEFTCTGCDEDIEFPTDEDTAQRLCRAGVRLVRSAPAISSTDVAHATRYLQANDHLVADILALPTEDSA